MADHHDSKNHRPEHHRKVHHEANREVKLTRDEEQTIDDGLQAIYGQGQTDFSKIERPKNFLTQLLLTLVVVLAVLAATAWGGYFFYQKYFAPSTAESFTVNIDAPEQLKSGERVTMTISYVNPTKVPMAQLTIDARLPAGFQVTESNPLTADLTKPSWEIGYLNAGSDGQIKLSGVWTASVPSTTSVQVFANFRPANFSSDFQAVETISINTLDSTLETTLVGTEESTPGQSASYTLSVQNNGGETLSNIQADLKLPAGFYLVSSTPALETGTDPSWSITNLAPGEKSEVTITGSFAADVSGFQYFDATTSLKKDNLLLIQGTAQSFTDVAGSDLSLQLVAGGAALDTSLPLGDTLKVAIAYQNASQETIDDLSILLDFSSDKVFPINWKMVDLDGGRLTKDGVLWSASALGGIGAGEKKYLNLEFPMVTELASGMGDHFTITAVATSGDLSVRSTPITVAINSDAALSAEIRYFTADGANLGSGPMPPTVGQTTTYRAYWTISNNLHDLENISVSALLPPGATWADQASADLGQINYKSETGEVTWTLPALPEGINSVSANFAISITPDADDIGKFVKLLSGSTFEATDAFTQTTLESTSDSLDSELPTDDFASGQGAVISGE